VHCPNKKAPITTNAEFVKATFDLPDALVTKGDTCNAARRAHIFLQHPRQLERQGSGLTRAGPGKYDAIPCSVVDLLLFQV